VSRVLVVAPSPPRRDGIAAYAAAQAARLSSEGDVVRVLSPPDGHGDVRVRFPGGWAFLRAAKLAPRFDRVIVHFQPSLYYRPRAPLSKIATSAALLWLVRRRRNVELLVHEADPPKRWRPDYLLLARAFRAAPVLLFHTDAERQALQRRYRVRVRGRLVPHAEGVRATPASRPDARARLDLAPDEVLFVSPGFLHPDKGFDRAVRAFAAATDRRPMAARLAIVGSVREPLPRNIAYASTLRELCRRTPGAELREGYLPDDELDAWIAAADAVVLPYSRSWSSGVLARAQVLGTPAIVSSVGGLPEQARGKDAVVTTETELADALRRVIQQTARAGGEALLRAEGERP